MGFRLCGVNESVLVFVKQRFRNSISPEMKLLKGFTKLSVAAEQSTQATITIDTRDISYWTPELRMLIDAGVYDVMVGNLSTPLTISRGAEMRMLGGKTTLHPLTTSTENVTGIGATRRLYWGPRQTPQTQKHTPKTQQTQKQTKNRYRRIFF